MARSVNWAAHAESQVLEKKRNVTSLDEEGWGEEQHIKRDIAGGRKKGEPRERGRQGGTDGGV